MERAELMKPGEIYELTIDLCATSNVFLVGHKLRLQIASSDFPRFDRNLNTGASPETSSDHITATNVIYHDRAHPSAPDCAARALTPVKPRGHSVLLLCRRRSSELLDTVLGE